MQRKEFHSYDADAWGGRAGNPKKAASVEVESLVLHSLVDTVVLDQDQGSPGSDIMSTACNRRYRYCRRWGLGGCCAAAAGGFPVKVVCKVR